MHRSIEVKKNLLCIIGLLFMSAAFAASKTYVDTEQKYIFTAENVAATIPDYVTEQNSQTKMAQKYESVMNPETGAVSIADLFAICRAGGLNTYRASGFEQCRNFVMALVNNAGASDAGISEEDLGGFCPGLDANGHNPNKLASITDKTRVGDMCTSSHIAMGEVVFQRDGSYSCTCMALACNGNYDLRGGACNTPIPVGTSICTRSIHKETKDNNTTAKCLDFCKTKGTRENCAVTNVVMRHSTKECICNANVTEVDAARESMARAANRVANLRYYSVCFDDKGKTGGTERCVEKVFNWVNVGQLQAVGIAQEYARVHYGDTIKCKSGYDTHWNDDYIQCTSTKANSKIYYEFQFDDVVESIDNDILADTVHSICKIHGLDDNVPHNLTKMGANALFGVTPTLVKGALQPNIYGCKTTSTVCSSKVNPSAQKFGYLTEYANGMCFVKERRVDRETADDNLARISGVAPYVFFHGIQIQGGQTIVDKLRKVISDAGHKVNSFRCDSSTGKINKAKGVIGFTTGNTDDILRCYINDSTPVDFVFEDFSESWLYKREEGEAAIQCIVSGGKFAGQKCHGLDKQQCIDAGKRLQAEFPGSSGTWWDGTDCVLVDASEAKIYDTGVNIGLGAVGAVDCVFGTKVGCVLLAVETAGLATEIVAGELINSRVNEFLSVGTRCKERSCALSVIRDLGGKVMTVQGSLDDAEMHAVDQTLAELIEYLEPEDLGALTGTEDWSQIIEQLGGDTNDLAGNVMVFAQYAGLIAQFASVGASGLRVTGRAIAKVAGKESKLERAGMKMATFLETSKKVANAADAASDAARAASHADDVFDTARGADNASDALRRARNMTVDEELGQIGVRYVGNGKYHDLRNGNRFISHEDVLKRIDDLPYETERAAARNVANATGAAANHAYDVAHTASHADDVSDAARGASRAESAAETERLRVVMNGENMRQASGHNAYISSHAMSENSAKAAVKRLQEQGYAASRIGVQGHSNGEEIVIAMTKEEAARIGGNVINGAVYRSIDNSANMARLRAVANGQELGRINGMKVSIDSMDDFGAISGRPIIMVRVGERKIPFYASSGQAGKTNVPTGKWEFFGGIGPNGGWFNKGGIDDIVGHYGSYELKQIADILDSKIGDLRNVEHVLESVGRESIGGLGKVASLNDEQEISVSAVNKYLRYTPSGTSRNGTPFRNNLDDIKRYLSQGG